LTARENLDILIAAKRAKKLPIHTSERGRRPTVAKRHDPMTVEDFLALDRERLDQKYEFRNGHRKMTE
jgi:hypothetical protein